MDPAQCGSGKRWHASGITYIEAAVTDAELKFAARKGNRMAIRQSRPYPMGRGAICDGFRNLSHFTRVFTDRFGLSPREYRSVFRSAGH